jgi:hypothetical protein
VDVDENTRVRGLVGAGEVDGSWAGCAGSATDGDLVAGHVELGAAGGHCGVEGDDLSADEVVAISKVSGNGNIDTTAATVHVLDTPEVVITDCAGRVLGPTTLEDLEEAGRSVGGAGIADLGHVDHDGTVVLATNSLPAAVTLTRLLVHLDSDGITSLDGALLANGGCAGVATHAVSRHILDWAVARRQTSALRTIIGTVDPKLLEGGVARHLSDGQSREDGSESRLHVAKSYVDAAPEI